jgi:tetratricopeptide (TPR) repeat protein
VAATPRGDPELAGRQSNLGTALQGMYLATGEVAPLREAVSAHRAEYLFNLGYLLRSRGRPASDAGLLAEADRSLAEAAESAGARAEVRIRAWQLRAYLAADRGGSADALAAMGKAVDLLPQMAPGSLGRPDREHQLGQLSLTKAEAYRQASGSPPPR